jgi:hypothetical protein
LETQLWKWNSVNTYTALGRNSYWHNTRASEYKLESRSCFISWLHELLINHNNLLPNLQVATFIAVYANWSFARIKGMGWGWAGVIWVYSIVTYIPLDILKFVIRYVLSGKAWDNLLENKVIAPSFLLPLSLS